MKLYSSKALREQLIPRLFFLSDVQKWRLDCWVRGYKECRKLRRADFVIVSYPKAGRTWLRTMLSRCLQISRNLPQNQLLGFENYHRIDPGVPKIFFTHDNVINHYTGNWDTKIDYYDKKIIFLVRDPRDVAVSLYFQWLHRINPLKSAIVPFHQNRDLSLIDHVMDEERGLPAIIRFLNIWARELPDIEHTLLVHYEQMHSEREAVLGQILDFLGLPCTAEILREVCEYTAFDNMKKIEQKGAYEDRRLLPGDRKNPDSFKVRRGKVGGYRDYFNAEELRRIETLVAEQLTPYYGYHGRVDELGQSSIPAVQASC